MPEPQSTRSFGWDLAIIVVACAALVAPARIPLLHVGFLSDDYWAGNHIAMHAEEHHDLPGLIKSYFDKRWVDNLEWFRPLLVLSSAADFAIFGADGRLHHVSNLIAWLAVAAAAGFLFPRIAGERRGFSVPVALLLLYPGTAETFGWIVGREDLMMTALGLLALRARLRHPDSILAPLPFLALALLCKETAVVIAPLINWVGGWVPRTESSPRISRSRAVLRELAPWLVLAAWFAWRYRLFGSLGLDYRGKSFLEHADLGKMLGHVAQSLLQLVAPVNVPQAAGHGISAWALRAPFVACAAAILGAGLLFHRRPGDGQRLMALLGVIGAPIVLVSKLYPVGEGLEQGRSLVLPSTGWAMLLGLSFQRALAGRISRAVAIVAIVVLIPVSMVSLWIALEPYAQATVIAEGILGDLKATGVQPGDEALMLRVEESPGNWRQDIVVHNGVYSLSSSIYSAIRPPFWPKPGLALRQVVQWPNPAQPTLPTERELARAAPDGRPRPWIVALRPLSEPQKPWFSAVAPGGSIGPAPEAMTPKHGAAIQVSALGTFEVRLPKPADWGPIDMVRIFVRGPGGQPAFEQVSPKGPLLQSDGSLRFDTKTTWEPILRAAGTDILVWWVEGYSGGKLALRTPWQAISVTN